MGVDIGGTKIAVCIADSDGNVLGSTRIPMQPSYEDTLPAIYGKAHQLLKELQLNVSDISACGICAPGPLDVANGLLLRSPNMQWDSVPFRDDLAREFPMPIMLENDANAGVLAEWFFGSGKGLNDVIYITMSTGVGGGIVSGGMYSYNTNRLRDWISAPKPNGYESLHVTVMGPEGKWVEVQIRTKRMDEVAEKGVAAHWKYKGIKSDSAKMDEWLKNLREVLENSSDATDSEVINEFKMQLYDDDVFVFTPKGDLHNLPKGATVLDFAFSIHTGIGAHCTGAVVNDKHVSFKYVLQNGDQISVLTSPNQTPKTEWLNYVVTSKARVKIKQCIKEIEHKEADDGREILQRRLKNWKMEVADGDITRLSKKRTIFKCKLPLSQDF